MRQAFENTYVYTLDLFKQLQQLAYDKMMPWRRWILLIGTFALATLTGLVFLIEQYVIAAFALFVTVFYIFFAFKGYVLFYKSGYKTFCHVNGTDPPVMIRIDAQAIQSQTPISQTTFFYENITHVLESDTIFVLIFYRTGLTLVKDGFQTGTADEFRAFIQFRCPNAKFSLKKLETL